MKQYRYFAYGFLRAIATIVSLMLSAQISHAEITQATVVAGLWDMSFSQDKKMVKPPLALATATHTTANQQTDDLSSFIEGKHYQRISFNTLKNPIIQQFILKDPDKIQVIEFFNYGCFWCGRLNRYMVEWAATKPDDVVYYQYPLVFNTHWEVLARVFYALRKMGKAESLDQDIFEAIHHNHINLVNNQELIHFMENHGIDGEEFMQTYHTTAVTRQVKQGNNLSLAYRISESPVVIVNTKKGSFLCSVPEVGSEARLIQLLNHLIKLAE